nr:uncharacterized protein LOC111118601 isoform X2 [Crassostrea virginica]XP_022313859.1 uncharacterized protein LOC111118601 isoform X2 [Crassostrea virginica]
MNPSAGKGATPYDWGKPIYQEDHSLFVLHPICSYVGNAIHWVFVLHYRGQSEDVSFVWGIFLAFTASYVYRIPILMFLMMLLAVLDKLHLAVMILISVKSIRILKVKYFPGLILLWMIYLYILDYVQNNLTLELRLRVFVFLFQNATFIVLYSVTSLFITAIIFWIYKPHQNIRTKRFAAFLQHATAFFYLHKAMPEKHLVGILPFHLTIVASSEFSIFIIKEIWRFVRYILYKFYSYLKGALKWTWNLFSNIVGKCVGVCIFVLYAS